MTMSMTTAIIAIIERSLTCSRPRRLSRRVISRYAIAYVATVTTRVMRANVPSGTSRPLAASGPVPSMSSHAASPTPEARFWMAYPAEQQKSAVQMEASKR